MIPEIGYFTLVLSVMLAFMLSVLPLTGVYRNNEWLMATGRPLASGLFFMLFIGFLCLAYAMATDDFSVAYVSNHSNTALPMQFKISAIWGGHEGSMFLWVLILSGWVIAVAQFSKNLPTDMMATVMGLLGLICLGFVAFLILTSNPFDRILPNPPMEGRDLNPLLQDIGLILHPPMLYMGYVGFSVAFVFAIAALISGRMDTAWARWARPWTNVAWVFLTLGIALGSWWAYYELGWGGWWFWDPVENASFMPWLIGTALIHSMAVTEKRGAFKSWTVLLAIFAFSFSLLGTFLVRSGVLTSVHAFASDPSRGYFILALLAITIGGSLTLFAMRAPKMKSFSFFELYSRESFLFFNNILLTVAAFAVLLGTLMPLLFDIFQAGKISVGPPIFNMIFNSIMTILLILMGIGPLLRWKSDKFANFKMAKLIGAVSAVLIGLVFSFLYGSAISWKVTLGMALALWLLWSTVYSLIDKTKNASNFFEGLKKLNLGYYGMQLAHLGIAVAVVGVVLVSNYETEHDIRMSPGSMQSYDGYEFRFIGTTPVYGPNYQADRGLIEVYKDGELIAEMNPEKRNYYSGGNMMTEAAIHPGWFLDLYVAMGEPLGASGDWAVRIHVKPFVRWIWFGGLFMGLGGLLAIFDRRYRRKSGVEG